MEHSSEEWVRNREVCRVVEGQRWNDFCLISWIWLCLWFWLWIRSDATEMRWNQLVVTVEFYGRFARKWKTFFNPCLTLVLFVWLVCVFSRFECWALWKRCYVVLCCAVLCYDVVDAGAAWRFGHSSCYECFRSFPDLDWGKWSVVLCCIVLWLT